MALDESGITDACNAGTVKRDVVRRFEVSPREDIRPHKIRTHRLRGFGLYLLQCWRNSHILFRIEHVRWSARAGAHNGNGVHLSIDRNERRSHSQFAESDAVSAARKITKHFCDNWEGFDGSRQAEW